MERPDPPDLHGHRVLVVGASRAVAGAVAFAFAEAGADVALTTATAVPEETAAIDGLTRAIEAMGRRAIAATVDLHVGRNVESLIPRLIKSLGGIDIMVIAADSPQDRPTEGLNNAAWHWLVNANLGAVVFACRATAGQMAKRDDRDGPGRVILLLPNVAVAAPAAYVAMRVAAASLVPALAREWASLPLTVHGIGLPAGLDDEASGAETAYVALRLCTPEADEKNGRVLKTGSFR